MAAGPLEGVGVLEIAAGGGHPLTAMLLADMGADVVRVERAGRSRAELGPAAALRGRRSIVLDLGRPAGRDVVFRLSAASSVLMEGFRPGVAEAIGIGPDDCAPHNPALVYARLSGWGQHGPDARRPGHDLNFLGVAGALDGPGLAGRDGRGATSLADRGAPALLFAYAIVCGLFEAQRSGLGQVIDCASVDASLLMGAKFGPTADERTSPPSHVGHPFYSVYAAADGRYFVVGATEPRFRSEVLNGLGLSLPDDGDQATWPAQRAAMAAAFAARDSAHWRRVFAGREVAVTELMTPADAADHPQLQARESFTDVDGDRQPSPAPIFSRTPGRIARPPVTAGTDSRTILAGLGYGPSEVDQMMADGTVVGAE